MLQSHTNLHEASVLKAFNDFWIRPIIFAILMSSIFGTTLKTLR